MTPLSLVSTEMEPQVENIDENKVGGNSYPYAEVCRKKFVSYLSHYTS